MLKHRKAILVATISTVAAGYSAVFGATPPAAANKGGTVQPNVVVILADELGYGDLRRHGNDKIDTPMLDRLASQSAQC